MHYLKITKHGTWQFRFQIPPRYRCLFSNASEFKKSLGACDKEQAIIKALEIELEIRNTIRNNIPLVKKTLITQNTYQQPSQKKQLDPFSCLNSYSDSKKDIVSDKAIKMSHAKISIILYLLNKKQINNIRRLDAEEIRKSLLQYPLNAKKMPQLRGKTPLEAIIANQKLKLATLSAESVKDYIQKASSFFEWCLHMELTDINPFKGMKFKKNRKDSEAKHAYNNKDLIKIFSTEIHTQNHYKHPYYYWLPLLGYFTGARLNELCQLYKEDIYLINNIWVIKIDDRLQGQKLKNQHSRRIIPIHNKLIELGFIQYIESIDNVRIFPELKTSRDGFSGAASKWYSRFKTKLGYSKGYDFHSFRHTVATQFKQNDISIISASEILGHAQNSITYDRYGKEIALITAVNVINVIDSSVIRISTK
ncbi:site-specific integrase [Photobacterium iliopiscarium]|uniref:site-specific integrase n=1 Tax=Photobacterium iliopiscarium TaxID=56192 RepID=UPI00242FA6D0|nr:site-specific integrase [Photobacterium iliopiscarium]